MNKINEVNKRNKINIFFIFKASARIEKIINTFIYLVILFNFQASARINKVNRIMLNLFFYVFLLYLFYLLNCQVFFGKGTQVRIHIYFLILFNSDGSFEHLINRIDFYVLYFFINEINKVHIFSDLTSFSKTPWKFNRKNTVNIISRKNENT